MVQEGGPKCHWGSNPKCLHTASLRSSLLNKQCFYWQWRVLWLQEWHHATLIKSLECNSGCHTTSRDFLMAQHRSMLKIIPNTCNRGRRTSLVFMLAPVCTAFGLQGNCRWNFMSRCQTSHPLTMITPMVIPTPPMMCSLESNTSSMASGQLCNPQAWFLSAFSEPTVCWAWLVLWHT